MARSSRASTTLHPDASDIETIDLSPTHHSPLVSIQFGNAVGILTSDLAVLDAIYEAVTRAYELLVENSVSA